MLLLPEQLSPSAATCAAAGAAATPAYARIWGWLSSGCGTAGGTSAMTEVHESLYLAQYWAFCLVFFIRVLSAACSLSADFRRALDMDTAVLGFYRCAHVRACACERSACLVAPTPYPSRFDVPGSTKPSARQVYSWLLRARLPLVFEASRVFWDAVKRYLFTPCCVLYALLPLAFAIWHPQWAGENPWSRAGHVARSAALLLPNLTTAFLFQSYMLNIAAGEGAG